MFRFATVSADAGADALYSRKYETSQKKTTPGHAFQVTDIRAGHQRPLHDFRGSALSGIRVP